MGTNYYHRRNICGECGRYDELHIGKNSAGWEFSFRAYEDDEGKRTLASWREWKAAIYADGEIYDEYGARYSYESFVEKVEKTKGKRSDYDYIRDSQEAWMLQYEFKDAEGWSFSLREFS